MSKVQPFKPNGHMDIGSVVIYAGKYWVVDSGEKPGELQLVPVRIDIKRDTIPFPTEESNSVTKLADLSLDDFAKKVIETAKSINAKWHGAVFISYIWKKLQPCDMTIDQFKWRLVQAHQADLIELSRADLVDALPVEDVIESEIVYHGARFHFVRLN